MRDFTLQAYSHYLSAIKAHYHNILRFDEYFLLSEKPANFCLIRHDIDRNPYNALRMAQLEYDMGITSSYYFRMKSHTFRPNLIAAIESLGHEVGYHYESLSDTNGKQTLALADFEQNLKKLRKHVSVKTIAMHGRPFKPYDNRELWRDQRNRNLLQKQYQILGELYLDIDYSDIAYITDTGRNWQSTKSNIRDRTNSKIFCDFTTGKELLKYLSNPPHSKMIFQIHPERWTDNWGEYLLQYSRDIIINFCKNLLLLFQP